MTPREKLLEKIQQLDAQLAKFTGALEVLDELGALGEEPATPPAAAEQEERTPTRRQPPPQSAAPAKTKIPPGSCFGKWNGSQPACRECDGAGECRAATAEV